jgi:acetamidase/formamidase
MFRPFCLLTAIVVTSVTLTAQSRPAASTTTPERLAGEWTFEMEGDGQPQRVTLTLSGDSLRGQVYGQRFAASLTGTRLTFAVGNFRWRASMRGDSLVGWLGIAPDSSRWVGVRDRRPEVARSLRLEPTTWWRGVSATATPALRIAAGDTVRTTTLDAGGWGLGGYGDRTNKLTMGGNPMTGPFYVEGALPGDVLIVKLHRVRLNRGWAFSGTWLMDNAIDVSYGNERKGTPPDAPQSNKWLLDTLSGTARLERPSAALANFSVPIAPFLGVIATAPGTEFTPSSRESGAYGGNMENRYIREGATVMLPVRTRGAFLYLGDGHAAQGDGELTGDAMETSLDVTFSVEIKRWGFNDIVRVEDAEQIMSVGVGGSLDEAMRTATSDMARWLEREYKLTSTEAALVMGFALRFDIPDVVPPGFGVTARLPKSALSQLSPR